MIEQTDSWTDEQKWIKTMDVLEYQCISMIKADRRSEIDRDGHTPEFYKGIH